jgi:hypothetical protein
MKTILAVIALASAQFFGAFEASTSAVNVLEGRAAQLEQSINVGTK